MIHLDRERWDWKTDRPGLASVVLLDDPCSEFAQMPINTECEVQRAIDMARISLVVDAPALLSALKGLWEFHVGFEAATYPDLRADAVRDLVHKYRRLNQRLHEIERTAK